MTDTRPLNPCLTCTGYDPETKNFYDIERCFDCVTDDNEGDRYEKRED